MINQIHTYSTCTYCNEEFGINFGILRSSHYNTNLYAMFPSNPGIPVFIV